MSTHEFAFFNSSLQFHIYFELMRQNMGSNQIIDWFGWKTLRRCLVGRQGGMEWFCLWFWNGTNLFCVWLRREWTGPFLVGIGTPKSRWDNDVRNPTVRRDKPTHSHPLCNDYLSPSVFWGQTHPTSRGIFPIGICLAQAWLWTKHHLNWVRPIPSHLILPTKHYLSGLGWIRRST